MWLLQADVPFLQLLLKASENLSYSDVFRGYRNETLAWDRLITVLFYYKNPNKATCAMYYQQAIVMLFWKIFVEKTCA